MQKKLNYVQYNIKLTITISHKQKTTDYLTFILCVVICQLFNLITKQRQKHCVNVKSLKT